MIYCMRSINLAILSIKLHLKSTEGKVYTPVNRKKKFVKDLAVQSLSYLIMVYLTQHPTAPMIHLYMIG